MSERKQSHFGDERPAEKPYMPTPDQYVTSLPGRNAGGPLQPVPTPRRGRQGRSLGSKIGRVFVVLVLLIVLGAVGYGAYIASSVAKISTNPLQLTGLASDLNGRTNVLVLGIGDPGHAAEKLSDTMMVVSLDAHSKKVTQISIPRDLRVDIPGYGKGKINSANAYGGTPLAEQVVSNTLGISIHYYVKTNFSGLRQMVDAVGGIDVNVKDRLYDPEYPCDANESKSCGLDIQPGLQHMDGTRALQYARCRKGTCGDDFGRAARQQEVLNLVRDKVVRWDVLLNPARLTPVVTAVHSGISTDMGAVQMLQFAQGWQAAKQNEPRNFVLSTSTEGLLRNGGGSDLVPVEGDFSAVQAKVQELLK
ncbi:MAG: putative LytR family transcriptional protein [Patescibacteria group bacterium]|nr:putative LytR family transcriptional protein [Patescibacteria group bacterium]